MVKTCGLFFAFYSSDWELKIDLKWEGADFYKNQASLLSRSDTTDLSHLQSTSIWVLLGFHKRVHN